MNLLLQSGLASRHGRKGFTLMEMIFVVALFGVIMLALVSFQLITLRLTTFSTTKLTATTSARYTLNAIRDQVRSAQTVYVGTYNPTSSPAFLLATNGALQTGNALEIFPDNTGNNQVIYYLDTTRLTNTFFSVTNSVATPVGKYATNYNCFFAEDYQGNVISNYIKNPVIHVILQFSQWEYSRGANNYSNSDAFDPYRLETRVSRRAR
jgi:prepilin-type N-terminal cleavage/methylation domain-containing protein